MKGKLLSALFAILLLTIIFSGCSESDKPEEEEGIMVYGSGMSHGDSPQNGIIDKGDVVYSAEVSNKNEIISWALGKSIDYEKYGDYGDVILFDAVNDDKWQIVRRAMCWIE